MINVGITGGIGSGKSIVCKVFKNMGIPVFTADVEASSIMNTSPVVIDLLIKKFGKDIYLSEGQINRSLLASILFNNKESLLYINSVIHPIVKKNYLEWSLFQTSKYNIIETAILFESGVNLIVDKVISVYAPVETRVKRVMERDKIIEGDVLDRIKNQMPEDEKMSMSDFIIYNDDKQMVIPQIMNLHGVLSED